MDITTTTAILNMEHMLKCGQCRVEFEYGAHVCHGCRGDVVYGATQGEFNFAFVSATIISLVGSYNLLKMIPKFVLENFGVVQDTSLGFWLMGGACVTGWVLAYYVLNRLTHGRVRTFRRDVAR